MPTTNDEQGPRGDEDERAARGRSVGFTLGSRLARLVESLLARARPSDPPDTAETVASPSVAPPAAPPAALQGRRSRQSEPPDAETERVVEALAGEVRARVVALVERGEVDELAHLVAGFSTMPGAVEALALAGRRSRGSMLPPAPTPGSSPAERAAEQVASDVRDLVFPLIQRGRSDELREMVAGFAESDGARAALRLATHDRR